MRYRYPDTEVLESKYFCGTGVTVDQLALFKMIRYRLANVRVDSTELCLISKFLTWHLCA